MRLLLFIETSSLSFGALVGLAVSGLLLICSALVSGSEVAFFSLNPQSRKELDETKSKAASQVLALLSRPKKLLATILISNNFVNVALVLLSSIISNELFTFTDFSWKSDFSGELLIQASTLQFLTNVVAITFIILLFGEVIPKVYATKYPKQLALFMSIPFGGLVSFFHPLSFILVKSTNIIDKKYKKKSNQLSVDELGHALDITDDSATSEDEKKILEGIVKFGNTDVKAIMSPRVDVVSVDCEAPYNELLELILESGFSRLPVYKDDFDHVSGIIYIKDLLPHLKERADFDWLKLLREPFYVPENKKIDDLLQEFQEKKTHMAIVVDEYGGSQGIITLEDIIEEIVGEISDEFDDDDLAYSKIDDYNFVFEAKTPLRDVYKILEVSDELFEEAKGESDTLAGFLLELAGRIPKKNEKIKFEGFLFTVEAADKRRIKRIKVTTPDQQENDNQSKNYASLILLLIGLFFGGCEDEHYTPKPRGYFRVALPQASYSLINLENCPFSFEVSDQAKVGLKREKDCWFNIHYPKLNARIHFTYMANASDSLETYTEDARTFAMKHIVKADNIYEDYVRDDSAHVFGTVYDFTGNTASNFQFFLTDSSNHFLRGALYFEAAPNYDSLRPIEDYVKQDLMHAIESFAWK